MSGRAAASPDSKEDNMTNAPMTVLVVGATGSIGRLVVDEALRQGHVVRALVRTTTRLSRSMLKRR